MTASVNKKVPKSKAAPPMAKAKHASANANYVSEDAIENVEVNEHHVADDTTARGRSLSSKLSMDVNIPPLSKSVNAVRNTDDVLELTSDEGNGLEASDTDTLHSGPEDIESADEAVVKDINSMSIQTRSSNGISKKRFLKDAAIFSDEDKELPIAITPKKSRLAGAVLDFQSLNDDYNKLSDVRFVGNDDILSLSPLKLGQSEQHSVVAEGSVDPFLLKPMLKSGLILKSSKSTGKYKAVVPSADVIPTSDDGDFQSDEMLNVARAMAASAREQRVRDQKKLGSSSKSGSSSARIRHAKCDVVNADNAVSLSDGSDLTTSAAGVVATVATIGSPVAMTRRTFKDVFPQSKTTSLMSKSPLYEEDFMKFRVLALPDVCQVTDPAVQDNYLASDYSLLPHLNTGTLTSWSSSHGSMAQVAFSHWAAQCPDMSFDVALAAVRFVRYKNFINPSRVSPLDVNIIYTTHDRKRSLLQCNMKTAICLTPILSRDSYLVTATSFGLRNKYISGHFHSQEWQQFEAFATMVFDKPVMVAQLYNDALSFVTMGPGKDRGDGYSPAKTPRHAAILYSKPRSTGVPQHSNDIIANTSFKSILDYCDEVPVYDACEFPFDFASDLENIASVLPRFRKEIPIHSFVVVAYSMAHYMKDGNANLSTNILFAILVGTE